jgi:mRNA interferase MazF
MIAGDVVLLNFPFSDLSGSKLRPAVVVAVVDLGDFIACQVSSRPISGRPSLELKATDFVAGGLNRVSFALPGKLFTANRTIVAKRVGRLNDSVKDQIREKIVRIVRGQ